MRDLDVYLGKITLAALSGGPELGGLEGPIRRALHLVSMEGPSRARQT